MMRWLLTVFVAGLLLSSCVPNKKILYLQSEKEPKVNTISNTDSLARTYSTRYEEYILKPRDIISLRIGTLTDTEYDFILKYEESLGQLRKLGQYNQAMGGGQGQNQNQMMGGGGSSGANGGTTSALSLDRSQTGFELDEKGYLELPKIGSLQLGGLTLPQAEDLIKKNLQGYFETPVVRIQLLSFYFTILGEVTKEGRYTIYNPNANIFDAISISGNLTDYADRSKIKIIRFKEDKANVIYVNTLRENLIEETGFFLQPNDLIIVPPLQARASKKYVLPTTAMVMTFALSVLSIVLLIETLKN